MDAYFKKYILDFKRPSGTSRGVLEQKETFLLIIKNQQKWGVGECGIFRGLSIDDVPEYMEKLEWVCQNIENGESFLIENLVQFPSIQFGVEQAFRSLYSKNPFHLFESDFLNREQPISINGLIWMGDVAFMNDQIAQKIDEGFRCIKMKIGAINFKEEVAILEAIRKEYSKERIELRVDANGAFSPKDALEKLHILAQYQLHSIEQPIKAGQKKQMRELCEKTPLSIALDEELIGIFGVTKKKELLQMVKPQYVILKPSLIGGFKGSQEWIELANSLNIGWWVTSALESNIGLNAIAQWTATLNNSMPQGLGTGALFTNNMESPLEVSNGGLYYEQDKTWNYQQINDLCI
ncbi:o-succinylbenzoate synthase [Euzebyella saccharophila]|uniref:o-succinylbenzoate synthase n=1 Tax=Euzebyella saccharophila TaxID=679664 RepID=A0ABV8JYB7_9FLAO|nr:o-succinylbenzoate synthase [Euzebyella saccharophila]